MSSNWQHRKADTDEERFGLLDPAKFVRYRTQPIFIPPVQGTSEAREAKFTAAGFTCGVGSMLVGAQEQGFEVLGNIEWRDYYRQTVEGQNTFTDNFPGAWMARGPKDLPNQDLLPFNVTFAAGHPECGRFSALSYSVVSGDGGYRNTRESDVSDIPLFLKMVARFKPRFFLMDDLPKSFNALPMEEYVKLLPEYDLFPEWISNWGYGNIQKHRNRMFIVGALKEEKFTFVPGEEEHTKKVKDVIGDLVDIDLDLANHQSVDPNARPGRYVNTDFYGHRPTWEEIRTTNQDLFRNLPYCKEDGTRKTRPGTRSPGWDETCPVLSGGFTPLHPIRKLPMSIRERARIQGFPDDFVFFFDEEGPFAKIWTPYRSSGQKGIKQTGKSMPIQFCTYVSAQILAHLEGEHFSCTGKRVLKPQLEVSTAKQEFCYKSGYSDQESACSMCWMKDNCEIREDGLYGKG